MFACWVVFMQMQHFKKLITEQFDCVSFDLYLRQGMALQSILYRCLMRWNKPAFDSASRRDDDVDVTSVLSYVSCGMITLSFHFSSFCLTLWEQVSTLYFLLLTQKQRQFSLWLCPWFFQYHQTCQTPLYQHLTSLNSTVLHSKLLVNNQPCDITS